MTRFFYRSILALALGTLVTGCITTAEQQAQRNEERCADRGYKPKTDLSTIAWCGWKASAASAWNPTAGISSKNRIIRRPPTGAFKNARQSVQPSLPGGTITMM